jgi:integrase/recombinase XerD
VTRHAVLLNPATSVRGERYEVVEGKTPQITVAGAVAKLRRGSLYHAGDQCMLHFDEKGGTSREVPVRHDLEQMLFAYLDAAGLRQAGKDTPCSVPPSGRPNSSRPPPCTSTMSAAWSSGACRRTPSA